MPWHGGINWKAFHDGHANKFTFSFQGKKITLLPLSPREVNEDQLQMIKKRKEEKARGHESKKSMITLKGVKKVMLAQKPIFLAYPSESSPSFQNPHSRCPLDLSLVLDEFKDVFQEPPKGFPPLKRYITP